MTPRLKWFWLALALSLLPAGSRADVLVGTNNEQFVGKVISETPDRVVFESELGGRLTFPRARIRELIRTPPPAPTPSAPVTNDVPLSPQLFNLAVSSNLLWSPPALGIDGSDWVQLKTGEWLRGQLKYVQEKKVEFDSDELGDLSLKLKNVRQIYPFQPMYAKFEGLEPAFGKIVISNGLVSVRGPEQLTRSREELIGLTRSGIKGIKDWSGKLSVGLSLQSGNKHLATVSANGELDRRTPNTHLNLEYTANYGEANGVESANNQRVNLTYDINLNRRWFARPAQLEYYYDPVANISSRGTAGVGAGCHIFDREGLEWTVAAGPGYQYTRFETVEAGQAGSATTPAGVLQSIFKLDITRRLDLSLSYLGTLTSERAGLYTHHGVSTLSFEIKRHLDLEVSYTWDFLEKTQLRSNGQLPHKNDYYLTAGLAVRF